MRSVHRRSLCLHLQSEGFIVWKPLHGGGHGRDGLELLLGSHQLLDLGKLVVEVQALGVRQRGAGLDDPAGHDLLHGKLDLLEVDGCLR